MNNGEFCKSCGERTVLSVNGYVCINPACAECKPVKGRCFPVNEEQKEDEIGVGTLVFIKDLGIYGNVTSFWEANNLEKGGKENNYIIEDIIGIEHERWEYEIEKVNDIEDSIRGAKCNIPLEKLIDKFNEIDKRYQLTIEVSKKKENAHSDVIVPFVCVRYGETVYNLKENKSFDTACFIKDGKLFLPEEENYLPKEDEYECCIWYYDTDVKETVFELYMNIITRLKK